MDLLSEVPSRGLSLLKGFFSIGWYSCCLYEHAVSDLKSLVVSWEQPSVGFGMVVLFVACFNRLAVLLAKQN